MTGEAVGKTEGRTIMKHEENAVWREYMDVYYDEFKEVTRQYSLR